MEWPTIEFKANVALAWRTHAAIWKTLGAHNKREVIRCQRNARKLEKELREYANSLLTA